LLLIRRKTIKLAIVQIILGALVIIAFPCPCPWSNVLLGAAVLGVAIAQLIESKKVKKPSK